jgi:hypothetical protein
MTLTQRRALNGHADTQALLGDQVQVVRLRPKWAMVVVPSQPSQLDPRGYPGWVPRRQLTARPPVSSPQLATVVVRTAWLRTDRSYRASQRGTHRVHDRQVVDADRNPHLALRQFTVLPTGNTGQGERANPDPA